MGPHKGASFLSAEHKFSCSPSLSQPLVICRYLMEHALVALVPGDAFGAPDCLRISYAASLDTIKEALDRVEAALQPARLTRGQ